MPLGVAARKSQAGVRKAARGFYGDRASSGLTSAASGAMSAVGTVWSFVSAEDASDVALEPPPKMDISVSVTVLSQGEHRVNRSWSHTAEAATDGSLSPEDAALLPASPKMDISVSSSLSI